ncbi:unnamed protein product [Amaranthus hypochondriacus]
MMKSYRGKLPLPIIVGIICVLAFFVFLYNQRMILLSSTYLVRISTCARQSTDGTRAGRDGMEEEDKLEYDADICDVSDGKWVFNRSIKPLYSDRSCPYLDKQVSCVKNGRPDSNYRYWHWQPDECSLRRFNPERALKRLKGKRLLFVGDSLQRGQWQSFVCLVESIIPDGQKSMKRGRAHSVFRAKEYNATIEFYWAPFLVESNSDLKIVADPRKRILKVDSVAKHAKHWLDVDFLVFNTYVWWMSGLKINSLWGSFANGEEGYEALDAPIAYRLALKTWANWIDSTIDPNKTRVFFTTMSPTHMRPVEWNNKDGIKCFNETKPVKKRGHWGSGSDKRIMQVVADVLGKMKVPVTVLNVTQLSEYRVDAHTKVYTETGGKLLTDEQKADPLHHADCIHWCLPGVPDTWNQIFLSFL